MIIAIGAMMAPTASAEPATQQAEGVSGEWEWVLDYTPGLIAQVWSKFSANGKDLTGTVDQGGESRKVLDGKIDGAKVYFRIEFVKGDLAFNKIYTGELKNGHIIGKMESHCTDGAGKTITYTKDWDAIRTASK